MRPWRMTLVDVRRNAPTIFADIYESEELVAEHIEFTQATKIVRAHNRELKNELEKLSC